MCKDVEKVIEEKYEKIRNKWNPLYFNQKQFYISGFADGFEYCLEVLKKQGAKGK